MSGSVGGCHNALWKMKKHAAAKSIIALPALTQTVAVSSPTRSHFGVDVKTDPNEFSHFYESLFVQFDHDSSGTVDLDEFKSETKWMMLAMASGLGFLPVQMILEEDIAS